MTAPSWFYPLVALMGAVIGCEAAPRDYEYFDAEIPFVVLRFAVLRESQTVQMSITWDGRTTVETLGNDDGNKCFVQSETDWSCDTNRWPHLKMARGQLVGTIDDETPVITFTRRRIPSVQGRP
jgi:hypothetical protein